MPQPDHVSIYDLPDPESLDDDMASYFAVCEEKLGMVPNVLRDVLTQPRQASGLCELITIH